MISVEKNHSVYAMSPDNAPVVRVSRGSQVEIHTFDCFEDQIQSAQQETCVFAKLLIR